ncbi:unnamed protein product [Arctogadus glacialis]
MWTHGIGMWANKNLRAHHPTTTSDFRAVPYNNHNNNRAMETSNALTVERRQTCLLHRLLCCLLFRKAAVTTTMESVRVSQSLEYFYCWPLMDPACRSRSPPQAGSGHTHTLLQQQQQHVIHGAAARELKRWILVEKFLHCLFAFFTLLLGRCSLIIQCNETLCAVRHIL